MAAEYIEVAAAVTSHLAPFTPYLVEGGKKFAGEAGKAAWEKAQVLWEKLKARFSDDKKLKGVIKTMATDPQDNDYQQLFAKVLAARLENDNAFTQELLDLLGGKSVVQKVLADRSSWVEDVIQDVTGESVEQIVKAENDSVIKGVKQIKR